MQQAFVLSHGRAPGDITVMTALVRDLKLTYPDISVAVQTSNMAIWENNPYISPPDKDARFLKLSYGQGLYEQNWMPIHFLAYFHRDFHRRTGIQVPLRLPYPDLHMSEAEKAAPLIQGRYWVLLSGGKSDFTIKVWETAKFQRVIDELLLRGIQVVQHGAAEPGHWHPPLQGVTSLVGQLTMRQGLQLIYHAEGVICGVTFAMHVAAAFQKPSVVLAGGREAWWWEAYVPENKGLGENAHLIKMPHKFLHTIGLLDCCRTHGCWKCNVVPLDDGKSVCQYPLPTAGEPVAKCMDMISPEHVVKAVMQYYEDGSLPPIQPAVALPAVTPISVPPLQIIATLPPPPPIATAPAKGNKQQLPRQVRATVPAAVMKALTNRPQPVAKGLGRLPVFVLLYGGEEHFEMHYRCLTAIIATIPAKSRDIRVVANQLNTKSRQMLEAAKQQGHVTIAAEYRHNAFKYPVMRELLLNPQTPFESDWCLWFDDDSMCDKDRNWFPKLSQMLVAAADDIGIIGTPMTFDVRPTVQQVFEARPWYKGRQWPIRNGKQVIPFVHGGFWAARIPALLEIAAPDLGTGLTHNGGDWQIGAQLFQNNYRIGVCNANKELVETSAFPRRGVTMPVPGLAKL